MRERLKYRLKCYPGESLLEVLVAVGMLTILLGGGMTIYHRSLQTIGTNRTYLVAANLASEGIEAVRHTLLSNRLRFPNNIDNCWNALPSVTDDGACVTADTTDVTTLGDASDSSTINYFTVAAGGAAASGSADSESVWIFEQTTVSEIQDTTALYRLQLDTFTQRYNHQDEVVPSDPTAVCGAAAECNALTPYYRQISITYPNTETLSATATVQWIEGGNTRTVRIPLLWEQ